MLKTIPKIISPDLLKILYEMGHGDEIVLGDGNFPAANYAKRLVRADGHGVPELLSTILELIPLDTYPDANALFMEVGKGEPVPVIWDEYKKILSAAEGDKVKIGHIERFAFYERCKSAYAIVATGEGAVYANIILKKGVIK
jgi:L-fucose mutarotase